MYICCSLCPLLNHHATFIWIVLFVLFASFFITFAWVIQLRFLQCKFPEKLLSFSFLNPKCTCRQNMKIHVLTENDAPYETGTFSWLSATLIEELSFFWFRSLDGTCVHRRSTKSLQNIDINLSNSYAYTHIFNLLLGHHVIYLGI